MWVVWVCCVVCVCGCVGCGCVCLWSCVVWCGVRVCGCGVRVWVWGVGVWVPLAHHLHLLCVNVGDPWPLVLWSVCPPWFPLGPALVWVPGSWLPAFVFLLGASPLALWPLVCCGCVPCLLAGPPARLCFGALGTAAAYACRLGGVRWCCVGVGCGGGCGVVCVWVLCVGVVCWCVCVCAHALGACGPLGSSGPPWPITCIYLA